MLPAQLMRRFWSKVRITSGCWEWQAALHSGGYGVLGDKNKTLYAHRISYEWFVGAIPPRFQIDHLCRNRKCVNPRHLELVTSAENTRRGALLIKQCPQGHFYNDKNTYRHPINGRRACRKCRAEGMRRCNPLG